MEGKDPRFHRINSINFELNKIFIYEFLFIVNLNIKKMKIRNSGLFVLLPVLTGAFLMLTAFGSLDSNPLGEVTPEETITIPDDIQGIFDKSCFGCHNSESTSDKAKKKLLLDQFTELSKVKLIGKLSEIAETVEKNEMPPEKFLSKYPDKALTNDEAKRLKEWADKTTDDLMK